MNLLYLCIFEQFIQHTHIGRINEVPKCHCQIIIVVDVAQSSENILSTKSMEYPRKRCHICYKQVIVPSETAFI